MGTGEKATGEPIKIGSINTNVPGIDFTWISSMAKAYFDCVNDNGGINGRPIEYIEEDEHIDPRRSPASRRSSLSKTVCSASSATRASSTAA